MAHPIQLAIHFQLLMLFNMIVESVSNFIVLKLSRIVNCNIKSDKEFKQCTRKT